MSDHITNVSDDDFESEVLNSEKPVLVDYWAEWCGPCKALGATLAEVAPEVADKVKIVKMNIDENPNTSPKYGVRSLPTMMIFKGGEVESMKIGALSKSQLEEFISQNT